MVDTWRKIPAYWQPLAPVTVRTFASRGDDLYVGVGGVVGNTSGLYKLTPLGLVLVRAYDTQRVHVLATEESTGYIYIGIGTAHSLGAAAFGRIDRDDNWELLHIFEGAEFVYSMCWHDDGGGEKLYLGTLAEDVPGSEAIWRWDNPGLVQVAGPGVNGWPTTTDYIGIYELISYDGVLHAGTYGTSAGKGDVFRLVDGVWENANAPVTLIILTMVEWNGHLTIGVHNGSLPNLVYYLDEADDTWKQVGTAPAAWATASLPNHIAVDGVGVLYAGIGGYPAGTGGMSVWKFASNTWTKIGGGGLNSSWQEPFSDVAEWIYKLYFHSDGELYVAFASEGEPIGQVWELASPSVGLEKDDLREWTTAVETVIDVPLLLIDITETSTGDGRYIRATSEEFDGALLRLEVDRTASASFNYLVFNGDADGAPFRVWTIDGTGNIAQGSSTINPGGFNCAYTLDGSTAGFTLAVDDDLVGGFTYTDLHANLLAHDDKALVLRSNNIDHAEVGLTGGLMVGSPGGGDKGVGNINLAGDLYKNNAPYTNPDFVFEHFYTDGKIAKFANNEGARDYRGLMPFQELRDYTRGHLRLPGITDEPADIFDRFDVALTKMEENALRILDIHDRIAAVRSRRQGEHTS